MLLNSLESLKINSTPQTPEINFDLSTGVFLFSGVSVPENSLEFYSPIIKWLKNYSKMPSKNTQLIFKLTYVNTSSLQYIYDLLMVLDVVHCKTSIINIIWNYTEDDIDMKEMGEDLKEALNADFSCVEAETVD